MNPKRNYGILPFQSPDGWAVKSKVTRLINKNTRELVGLKIENSEKLVTVPIVDATKSQANRDRAERIIKSSRSGSMYIKPSFSGMGKSYNASQKF